MIDFACPCGKPLHARDEYAGQMTRCPGCGRDLVIPGEQRIQDAAPPGEDRPRRRDDRDALDRPPTGPATSGLAVASVILGALSLLVCSILSGLPAIIMGALGLRAIGRSEGRLQGTGLAIAGIVTGGLSILLLPVLAIVLLLPAVQKVREASNRIASANNLKQMAIAMHGYNDAMGTFPPAAICDPSGKPLLSWRVAILPYIEQGYLYNQFHLDEPWDSPNNIRLLSQMPKTYALPGATAPTGFTYYRVFVGEHAAFPPPLPSQPGGMTQGRRIVEFFDGISNTVLVVEAANAVEWTKPDELTFDPNGPLPPLGGHYGAGFQAVMADGSIHHVSDGVSPATLRNAIQIDDGNLLGTDW